MSTRDELMAACAAGDEGRVDLAGWDAVLRALRWWTKPGRVTLDGTVAPIADAIGDEDPDQIVKALRALLDELEWRPSAAQIRVAMYPPQAPDRAGRGRTRPDLAPAALQAVRLAAEREEVCDCFPFAGAVTFDADHVHRCADCGGLELGQYDRAMESADASRSLGGTAP